MRQSAKFNGRAATLAAPARENGYDRRMGKTLLICVISFIVGAVVTAAPFLSIGYFAHLEEAAREQETMGPGITTAFGLLASPVGGIVAVAIALLFVRRKNANVDSSK